MPTLSEAFLRSLNGMQFVSRRRRSGSYIGERRSHKRGQSVEFADYRNYTPGDDPRRVDWNIYARLQRPYIKLFEEEQDLTVHVLVDASPSMRWKDETENESAKWTRATQLALSLAHIALVSGDRVQIETNTGAHYGPKRGAGTAEVMSFLENAAVTGAIPQLNEWLRRYASHARSGVCVLISDLLDERGYADGLNALASKMELRVLQTLCPAELDPVFEGDLRLKDVETSHKQDISLYEATMNRYAKRLDEWLATIREYSRAHGVLYWMADTALPIEQTIVTDLRREGWLR